MHHLLAAGCDVPVILHRDYRETDIEALQLKAAIDFGTLLLDGFGDGIMLHNEGSETMVTDSCMFGILQATRTRISKTEYISCPKLRTYLIRLANNNRPYQESHFSSERLENRYHGVYRERSRRNGRC